MKNLLAIGLACCLLPTGLAAEDPAQTAPELGMQTFDQALFDLFEADMITYEDALRNADSVNDLRLKIKLESKNAKNRDLGSGLEHLEIVK